MAKIIEDRSGVDRTVRIFDEFKRNEVNRG